MLEKYNQAKKHETFFAKFNPNLIPNNPGQTPSPNPNRNSNIRTRLEFGLGLW